jgi:hypothetical protein
MWGGEGEHSTYAFCDETDVLFKTLAPCTVLVLRPGRGVHAEEEAGCFEGEGLSLDGFAEFSSDAGKSAGSRTPEVQVKFVDNLQVWFCG